MSTEEEKKAKEQPKPEELKHEPEQGDFAAGERTSDVDETGSDFAAGERTSDVDETGSDFAAGQRTEPDDLEDNSDFARGEDDEEKKEE